MALLHIERLGGMAGIGSAMSRIRSVGQCSINSLSEVDQQLVQRLFEKEAKSKDHTRLERLCDGFRYRLTQTSGKKIETIDVDEADLPHSLILCVKDELI